MDVHLLQDEDPSMQNLKKNKNELKNIQLFHMRNYKASLDS